MTLLLYYETVYAELYHKNYFHIQQECIEGICGNWNGIQRDDLYPRDEFAAASMVVVGDSWRVTDSSDGSESERYNYILGHSFEVYLFFKKSI